MAVVGFEGSQEVASTRDLCSCGANLLRVDLRKVSLANIQLNSMIHCYKAIIICIVTFEFCSSKQVYITCNGSSFPCDIGPWSSRRNS